MSFDETMLVDMLKDNQTVAYEHLVELYADKIYKTSLFLLGNSDDAQDAVQDVFLAVHKNIKKFKGDSGLSTWIYRITVNSCHSISRKYKNKAVSVDSVDSFHVGSDVCDIDDVIIVKDAILSLKNDYKTVLVLRDIEGFTYDDISQILKLPVGTVKSRVNRARSELRNLLADFNQKGDVRNGLQ